MIVQHHVVRARHGNQERHARDRQQGHQRVHVVLVGLGVVGVTDIDAHRHAHQLAAEVVLQPGANDLLAVIQVLRPDETDHAVDQQRLKRPSDSVGSGFHRLLIDTVMRICRQG